MKIAFSTLGCPGWSWKDIIVTAKDLGFDGIELRGIEKDLDITMSSLFTDDNIDKTRRSMSDAGLEISCLTSSSFLFDTQDTKKHMKEANRYIDLAEKLGTPFVRVLGDSSPEPREEVSDDIVASNLILLSDYAEGKNVKVLIETNGAFSDSGRLLKLLERVDSKNVGVLWDIHHPFRFMNEPVEKTYSNLEKYIEHVHIKDSVVADGKVIYKMIGSGDLPVKDAVNTLKNSGYNGYISLEWVKRWNLELEEPGIVFSHFINIIRGMLA